jgi:hypothetical protein
MQHLVVPGTPINKLSLGQASFFKFHKASFAWTIFQYARTTAQRVFCRKVLGHLRMWNTQKSIPSKIISVIVNPAFWVGSTRSSSGHFGDAILPVVHPFKVAKLVV